MGIALRLVDETPSGTRTGETILRLVSERITVRELIERRVRQEVTEFLQKDTETVFRGLVQPSDSEQVLNGFKLKKPRQVDPDEQVAKALEAFEGNGFLLLVDDRQLERLDDEIIVTGDQVVSFVKLVPLVGG